MFRHILPNAIAPVIVVSTIALGRYIAAEATLSFLGVGLQPPDDLLGHRHLRRAADASCDGAAHAAVPGRCS